MKKLLLIILLIMFPLYSCTDKVSELPNNTDTVIEFPYSIEYIISLHGNSKMYCIKVSNNLNNEVKLSLFYENDDFTSSIFERKEKEEFKYNKSIILNSEQVQELFDIISKISSYKYSTSESLLPEAVDLYLTIKNTKTNENHTVISFYNIMVDENMQLLSKKLIEFSPVPILDYQGNLLILEDTYPSLKFFK